MDRQRRRIDTGQRLDTLDDLIEERQAVWSLKASSRIDADRHRATGIETRIDVEQRRQTTQQQPAGHGQDDDDRDLRRRAPAAARIRCVDPS